MRAYPFALAALAPLMQGAAESAPVDASGDFCQRLAQTIGVKVHPKGPGPTTWTVNATPLWRYLVPVGTVATGLGAHPIEPASADDFRRADAMCEPEKKGAVCRLLGPVRFTFIWHNVKTYMLVRPGERATVRVVNVRTTCEAGGS